MCANLPSTCQTVSSQILEASDPGLTSFLTDRCFPDIVVNVREQVNPEHSRRPVL
jgi:hypothetical protein